MANILFNNKLSFKVDITDVSEIDGSVELSININILYNSCDCSYNDRLWFNEDDVKNFTKDLSVGKDSTLADIDSNFIFKITTNKLNIEIHKKDFYIKDTLNMAFEMPIHEHLPKIKNAFDELYL